MDSGKTLSLPPLKALQAFEQTARFANVARAAEQLAITASAVSHQLAKLEALVGRALFIRGARGMTLTPAGEQYLEEVSEVLHRLAMATDRAASDAGLECLRLHSAPSFGLLWLMPRLELFRQSHPDLQINLSCSYESLHFSRDKVDIDIRHGLPSWPNLEIRTLQRERLAVLAAPQLLEKRPVQSPADLLHSELILSEATLMKWPNWFAQQGLALPERTTWPGAIWCGCCHRTTTCRWPLTTWCFPGRTRATPGCGAFSTGCNRSWASPSSISLSATVPGARRRRPGRPG